MSSTRITRAQTQGVARLLAWLTVSVWMLPAATPEYHLQIVHVYPHDASAFTQGLEYHDGVLFEGTGLEGRSHLRVESLATGKVIREISIDPGLFGEGISVLGGKVYQLTWIGGKGFVYDAATFRRVREFNYPGQGWGLTNDGTRLYMSDGICRDSRLGPGIAHGTAPHQGTRWRRTNRQIERAGMGARRDLGECLDHQPDCAHFAAGRACYGLD